MNLTDLLNQTEFFKAVSSQNKALLSKICFPKNVKKGTQLFHEGDKGFSLYILAQGTIRKHYPEYYIDYPKRAL
ncbi:MAG: hypothetical protein ABIA63_12480, partial [bacterium]